MAPGERLADPRVGEARERDPAVLEREGGDRAEPLDEPHRDRLRGAQVERHAVEGEHVGHGCYLLRAFLLTCWSCLVASRAARHAALAWSLSCTSCCAILA